MKAMAAKTIEMIPSLSMGAWMMADEEHSSMGGVDV